MIWTMTIRTANRTMQTVRQGSRRLRHHRCNVSRVRFPPVRTDSTRLNRVPVLVALFEVIWIDAAAVRDIARWVEVFALVAGHHVRCDRATQFALEHEPVNAEDF